MRTYLCISMFFTCALVFSQSEREVIKRIDEINSQASNHYNNNDIVQSFNFYNESIKLSDSINDHYGNALANFGLGKIYNYMNEYREAERCYINMLNESKYVDDNYLAARSFLNLGEMYINADKLNEVIPYFETALKYALKKDVIDQFNIDQREGILFKIRMNLSNVYLKKSDLYKAHIYLLRAKGNLDNLPNNYYSKGLFSYTHGLYFKNKKSLNQANTKFYDAINYLENNNSNDVQNNLLLSKVYKELSSSLSVLGRKDEAYNILVKYLNAREKFINEEKIKQENISKSKFLIAEYKRLAQSANDEKVVQQLITDRIKNANIIVTITTIILLIALIIIYKNYRSKRRLSNILKVQNEQLNISKKEAEKSSQLKSNFISNVTHELRTPLYGVVGLTSILLDNNNLSKKDDKLLRSLKYSGDYLLNLVNDILQIGKIESDKIELKNTSVNLKELIENIIDSFEYRLQENNNQIHFFVDDSVPKYVMCDNLRLSQIIMNLVGNSIKFTENGNIWIRLKNKGIVNGLVDLRFEIEDNGSGIDKKKQVSVFENFSQLNENNNINYQGTGLGLSIVKNLVELFNSKIELESELGKGALFSFDASFKVDNTIKENSKVRKEEKAFSLNGELKILLAEDNKINQIVTQNLLQKRNFKCQIVQNGLEAVEAFKNGTFDLVLMDINMPVMDGNTATTEIRKINPNIPVIALTASEIEEVKKNYKAFGYNDIITKPFDNFEFYQTITSNIKKSKQENNSENHLEKAS